jgi:hypothetical protein
MNEPKSAAQKARAWHLNALETVLLIGIVELDCHHRHLAMVVGNGLTTQGWVQLSETWRATRRLG